MLPLVAATMVSPSRISPLALALPMTYSTIRSLIEPVGFMNSHLPRIVTFGFRLRKLMSSICVSPILPARANAGAPAPAAAALLLLGRFPIAAGPASDRGSVRRGSRRASRRSGAPAMHRGRRRSVGSVCPLRFCANSLCGLATRGRTSSRLRWLERKNLEGQRGRQEAGGRSMPSDGPSPRPIVTSPRQHGPQPCLNQGGVHS